MTHHSIISSLCSLQWVTAWFASFPISSNVKATNISHSKAALKAGRGNYFTVLISDYKLKWWLYIRWFLTLPLVLTQTRMITFKVMLFFITEHCLESWNKGQPGCALQYGEKGIGFGLQTKLDSNFLLCHVLPMESIKLFNFLIHFPGAEWCTRRTLTLALYLWGLLTKIRVLETEGCCEMR